MKKILTARIIKISIIVLVIAGLGFVGYRFYSRIAAAANARNTVSESLASVMRGDLSVTISGTGTLEPILSYDIVPLVKGNILNAPYEIGMQVQTGDLLYLIDDSDLSYNIEKSRNSMEKMKISNQQTEDSIKNLTIHAPSDGRLESFSLKKGDQISTNSRIAEIINDRKLTVTVPFNYSQLQSLYIGQRVQLSAQQYMTYIEGSITYINQTPKISDTGIVLYDVEIEVENPGVVVEGTKVVAIAEVNNEEIVSVSEGALSYIDRYSVYPLTSGTVKNIYVKNNEWVSAGQILAELENTSLSSTSQRNALDLADMQLSLDSQLKQLEDYNILSPIDGTVIVKNYKAGDTINSASANTVLMTIADMSKMQFTIGIDELDIDKIAIGQKVNITADALPDNLFNGEVTGIAVLGNSQNGVTTYPVEITISEPGKLKPGMNVNAKILIESKTNVLYVPMAAVTKMGNKTFVYVKNDSTEGNTSTPNSTNNQSSEQNESRQETIRRRLQNGGQGTAQGDGSAAGSGFSRAGSAAVSGGTLREVTVGINTDNYIEIISGLSEGEIVILPYVTNSSTNTNMTGFPTFNNSGGFRLPTGGSSGGGTNVRFNR